MKDKVLFLNLPGKNLYLRDYYCSKVSQANYLLPPVDFIFQSAILKDHFDLYFIDSVIEKKDFEAIKNDIQKILPRFIVFLAASVSITEDIECLKKIKEFFPQIKLLGTGDIFLGFDEKILKRFECVDAFFYDFTDDSLKKYLKNEAVNSVFFYDNKSEIHHTKQSLNQKIEYNIPVPKHSLFLNKRYRYPFVKDKKFSVLLTDYGCPYNCSFCVMPSLKYKLRTFGSILEELKVLKEHKVKDLLILNQSFGANMDHAERLLKMLNLYRFRWAAFSRIDLITEKLLKQMKEAGCHTLIFGIESGSNVIQEYIGKRIAVDAIKKVFKLCRKLDVEVVSTFVMGLPHENHKTLKDTWNLINKIRPDYVSLNMAVPRLQTKLRDDALKFGLTNTELGTMDQSGIQNVSMKTLFLTQNDLIKYRQRFVISYYFNIKFLLKKFLSVRNMFELKNMTIQAYGMFKNSINNFFWKTN